MFRHGARFPGQGRFLRLQVDCFQQARIGGYAVPHLQVDDIARHQFPRRYGEGLSVPHGSSCGCGHLAQGQERTLGAEFLNETQNDGEEHDDGDRNRLDNLAQERRDCRRDQQDDYE